MVLLCSRYSLGRGSKHVVQDEHQGFVKQFIICKINICIHEHPFLKYVYIHQSFKNSRLQITNKTIAACLVEFVFSSLSAHFKRVMTKFLCVQRRVKILSNWKYSGYRREGELRDSELCSTLQRAVI